MAAVPGLVARLRSGPPHGRAAAADALAGVKGPAKSVVPELFAAFFDDPNVTVRRRIAHALCLLIRNDEVGRWLASVSRVQSDADPEVREHIGRRLERAGPAAGPLAPGLANDPRLDEDR
jgi:hypothetical protein